MQCCCEAGSHDPGQQVPPSVPLTLPSDAGVSVLFLSAACPYAVDFDDDSCRLSSLTDAGRAPPSAPARLARLCRWLT